jgi:hypothetical protein
VDTAEIYMWINANVLKVRAVNLFKVQNAGVSEIFVFTTLHGLTLWEIIMIIIFACVEVSDCKRCEAHNRSPTAILIIRG